jgi:hypothetical protein
MFAPTLADMRLKRKYRGGGPDFTEATMRKAIAAVAGLLVMVGATVAAQDVTKTPKETPKAAPGHDAMAKSGGGGSDAAKIERAMSAAPPSISRNAAIMDIGADGKMKQLRAGTNGWVCMLEPNGVPMCLDKEWQGWADAWINKKDPQVKNVGIAYMLKGDKGASNTDPYADKQTADNQWVVSGPHVMVLTANPAQLDALPTDPNNGGPWVMWKGTKYAHIMVPTAPMPKTPPMKSSTAKPAEKKQ